MVLATVTVDYDINIGKTWKVYFSCHLQSPSLSQKNVEHGSDSVVDLLRHLMRR